ncbi:hypothetical protein M0802_006211 [Mischocyttarus mexicanus]|nr:hypothetical protein M0802_006211 [Mischocyttarus mexicanus]
MEENRERLYSIRMQEIEKERERVGRTRAWWLVPREVAEIVVYDDDNHDDVEVEEEDEKDEEEVKDRNLPKTKKLQVSALVYGWSVYVECDSCTVVFRSVEFSVHDEEDEEENQDENDDNDDDDDNDDNNVEE